MQKFILQFLTAYLGFCLYGGGINAYAGIAKEATWGTAVSPTDFVRFMSASLAPSIDRFDVANAIGASYEPDDMSGLVRITGDLSFAADPLFLGHILRGGMNCMSGSTVLSGFLYQTRFVTTQSDFAIGQAAQPYTVEVFHDVVSAHRFAGCMVDRLQLAIAPNQDLRVTASFIGKTVALASRAAPTYTTSPSAPFAFDTASLSIGGAGTARIEAFNLRLDNMLAGIPALNVSTAIIRVQRRAGQLATFGGTLSFEDVTEWLDFLNQTERAFTLGLTRANSFGLNVIVPKGIYTGYPISVPGRDRLTAQFTGKARFLVSSNTALDLQLTNTKSNY